MTDAEKLKYFEDKYGDNLPDNLKPVVYFLKHPPDHTYRPAKRRSDVFKRSSERQLAEMMMHEPGTWMMRPPEFDGRFDADFQASLSEGIEFEEGDDAETRELKRAVADAKAELAERVAAGEKASDILNEAGRSLYDLGRYRRELQEQLSAIKRDGSYSDGDVADFARAANEMLEKKGLPPLKMPNAILRRAGMRAAAKRAAAKAAQGGGK